MGVGLGRSPIIEPVANDVGLRIRIPHESNSGAVNGGHVGSGENKRCDSGRKERPPYTNIVSVEDMIIIA